VAHPRTFWVLSLLPRVIHNRIFLVVVPLLLEHRLSSEVCIESIHEQALCHTDVKTHDASTEKYGVVKEAGNCPPYK